MPRDTKAYVTNEGDLANAGRLIASSIMWDAAPGGQDFWSSVRAAIRAMSEGRGKDARERLVVAVTSGAKDLGVTVSAPPTSDPKGPQEATVSITRSDLVKLQNVLERYKRMSLALKNDAGGAVGIVTGIAVDGLREVLASIPALNDDLGI